MSEYPTSPRQSLSEISHLFLTGMRGREGAPASRPMRKPPAVSMDVTPEEFAGGASSNHSVSVSAVLAHHLAPAPLQRVRDYARHAASASGRVGLIELGDDGLRLTCFDASPLGQINEPGGGEQVAGPQPVNGLVISQAIAEMSWDIQRWILFLPGGLASPSARRLLRQVKHWTILVSADDQGVVGAYRVLKSASEIAGASISMAVFGADDETHAQIVQRKLAGASQRFLNRRVDCEGRLLETNNVSEHVALWCRASGGTVTGASQEHWTAVMELAAKSSEPATIERIAPPDPETAERQKEDSIEEDEDIAEANEDTNFQPEPAPLRITPMESAAGKNELEVQELPETGDAAQAADAILKCLLQQQTQWVGCPVKPPMCESATIAVDRDGRLILAAVSAGELTDLRTASRGYSWLIENRPLVRMALPQMNIDAAAMPKLVLCIDQAQAAGEQLASILQNGNVTVQTYRRLRWGKKTGLLLQAA